MGIDSVATQLYNIQSRKKLPLKTAIGVMAREELAARFSVYNLVRTVTRSTLLATAAERSFGKGTPLQRQQAEEERRREKSEKKFKAFTVNSLVNLNNRINLLAAVTERNTMLISQLFGEIGNYRSGRKINALGSPSAMRVPLRNKSVKGKLEEIQKSIEDLKKTKGKLGGPTKKKKEKKPPPLPAKEESGGLFGFLGPLLGLLGSGGALGGAAGALRLLLAGAGTGATALSLSALFGGSLENLKKRMGGENVNEDPFIESISQGKDNTVLATAAGGLTAAATMGIPLAYRMAKKVGKAFGADKTALGQKFESARTNKMNNKQLKYVEMLEKRYLKQGMLPDAARNKAFESASKAMSGRFGETATRFITGKADPKWLMVNKILTKAAKILPVLSAGLVAYEVSSMAGHHADFESKRIDFNTYKQKMSDGYSNIVQSIGVPAATTLLGSALGTAFGGPLGTLGGAAFGVIGGLGLSFFADQPADYIGTKIFEMVHENDIPPEIVAEGNKQREKEKRAEGVGGGMPAAAPAAPGSSSAYMSGGGGGATGSQVSSLGTQAASIADLQAVRESGTAKEAVEFFTSKGWTKAQAAGIVGNLMAESGLRTDDFNAPENAYGIAQWRSDRQERFAKTYGKLIQQAGFQEQLEFVHWELNNDESKAGKALRATTDASTAAFVVDKMYERSAGKAVQKRIDYANQLMDEKYVETVATTGQRAAVTGSGSVMGPGGTGGTSGGRPQPQGVGAPAPQTIEEKKVDAWAWSVYSGQTTIDKVPPSIAETVKKRLENVPSHWVTKRDEMNEPVDVAPETGGGAWQSVEQIDTEYTNTVTKLQELVGQGKLSQVEFIAQVEALDRNRRKKRSTTQADRDYESSVSALQTSRKENKITDAEFKKQVDILDKARKTRNRQLTSERQKGPESTQTAVQYLESKFPDAKDRTMYWVNGVRYARSVNSSTGKGFWYISYQEGKKKTQVNPEAAVILAKNKWTGPDKTVSDANAIFEAERAKQAEKVDSGEKKKAESTATPGEAQPTPTASSMPKIDPDSEDAFLVNIPEQKKPNIDPDSEDAFLVNISQPPSGTPATPATPTSTPAATTTPTPPIAGSDTPSTPNVPTANALPLGSEEEIPEVMVTATPRKKREKQQPEQETATPAETDPMMGAGINYGDAANPTKFIIEGFRPKDYPDEYFPALRRYLAGSNIGSKKARVEAEQKASEDIKQAILAGSIRPRGKTKLVSVETTYEELTPQTRFQQEPSAEVMQSPIPKIETSSSQTPMQPPDVAVEEQESSVAEDLSARIDGLQQQIMSTFQSTNALAASTSKLGKKVAENTQAMDNSNEFRTARNMDSGIGSYRSV
jgi:hypothetical protein